MVCNKERKQKSTFYIACSMYFNLMVTFCCCIIMENMFHTVDLLLVTKHCYSRVKTLNTTHCHAEE